MCGEHHRVRRCPFPQEGSSPHVRGALSLTLSARMLVGIIPACAGSTEHDLCCLVFLWDHPRMCGEHALALQVYEKGRGIIPACAGSTTCSATSFPLSRDHPRMCGEHSLSMPRRRSRTGSSPHVRGAPGVQAEPSHTAGIIPACAGSTSCLTGSCNARWDHPRMCGEHIAFRPARNADPGSSPHVRGAPGDEHEPHR